MLRALLPSPLQESLFLIRLASLLVPAQRRSAWRKEWEGEMWHASMLLEERGYSRSAARSQLRSFWRGSVVDAAWHRGRRIDRESLVRGLSHYVQSPGFCIASIVIAIAIIAVASGFLPSTRDVLLPLPYANADRIATISQSGMALSARAGIRTTWVHWWQRDSKLIEDAATYIWRPQPAADRSGRLGSVLNAEVSDNFFSLLGAGALHGRTFTRGDAGACENCVVLSYDFWRRLHSADGTNVGDLISVGGQRHKLIGVLPKEFWFLSRRIEVWSLARGADAWTGVVLRLGPDVTKQAAEAELESIALAHGLLPWVCVVDISPLQARVRSVFGSFALALALAAVIAIVSLRPRVPSLQVYMSRRERRYACLRASFFVCKTGLLLIAVLLSGLEFTRATSITMIGGTDALTEPLSTWLFLIACMGVLSWSIYDQRRRCRVCVRRLGLPAHVGCPGCLLLDWAGTEMVCMEGHGMLYVPEMSSSWQDPEKWTTLDDSWQALFARETL
jgi:hypothetical protein